MVKNVAKALFAKTLLVFALTIGSAAVRADTLLIDGIAVDQQSATSRPKSGMSMANVEAAYGTPTEKHGAVGEPPITRWDYPGFSVYFEHETVIHTVARHQ
jgi:hypothetical protein